MSRTLLERARKAFQTAINSQDTSKVYANCKSAAELYERAFKASQRSQRAKRNQQPTDVNPLEVIAQELGAVYCFTGNLYMIVEEDERAARCYDAAIKMLSGEQKTDALVGRAAVKKRRKDFSGAIDDINGVLMLAPEKRDECHYNLGLIGIDREDYGFALENLQKSVQVNPEFAIARAHLGDVYRILGDTKRAQHQYERALQVTEGRMDRLDMRDYRGAIRAEIGLVCHLSQEREPRFSRMALSKGLLSQQEIMSLTHFKHVGVRTLYPLRKPG